jgi:ketosteroid isomerase-like protein
MKTFRFFTALSLSLFLFTCSFAQDMTARNKKNILAAYDALSRRDMAAFAAVCAPEYTDVNVGPAPVQGLQACIEFYKGFFSAFPDAKFTIENIFNDGSNKYAVKLKLTGTNKAPLGMIPATGKSISISEGKCISHSVSNVNEALRQIGYGSMANPNVGLVIAAYEKFGKGDISGLLSMCTPDITFDIHDRMFDSKERVFNGPAAVGSFFQELGAKFQYTKFQPTRFIADGDDVIIFVSAEYTLTATGKRYSSTYTHYFKASNGKLSMFRGLDDMQKSLD